MNTLYLRYQYWPSETLIKDVEINHFNGSQEKHSYHPWIPSFSSGQGSGAGKKVFFWMLEHLFYRSPSLLLDHKLITKSFPSDLQHGPPLTASSFDL